MFGLFDSIADWFRGILIEGILSNFYGMFNDLNTRVSDIAGQVGQTPQGWHPAIFDLIRTLSETVVLPVAGVILTFILTYELITMIIEKNNMNDDVFCNGGISNAHKSNRKQRSTHLWQMTDAVLKGG